MSLQASASFPKSPRQSFCSSLRSFPPLFQLPAVLSFPDSCRFHPPSCYALRSRSCSTSNHTPATDARTPGSPRRVPAPRPAAPNAGARPRRGRMPVLSTEGAAPPVPAARMPVLSAERAPASVLSARPRLRMPVPAAGGAPRHPPLVRTRRAPPPSDPSNP